MVKVTKLNKETVYINPALIEMIEKTPDTLVTLLSGKKIIVAESVEEMCDIITEYFKAAGMTAPQIIFNSFVLNEND